MSASSADIVIEVSIRAASSADMLSVGLIERESFADPWGSREFSSALASPNTIFLIAHDSAGIVVGYVIAISAADEAEILNLAVRPAQRGHGIGARLLDTAIAKVKELGAEQVYLEVRESNEPAKVLYKSRGFDEVSRRRRYYRDPVEDALILHLAVQR
ncbi:MAG TPA: ribosomal protein S18-alanine N-acetyltransferase [Gemmatimonadaceae bacterium]